MALKKLIIFISILLISVAAYAGQRFNAFTGKPDYCASMQEDDGSPSNTGCGIIKVSDGTLTDNGDGSFNLDTTGGAGGAGGWTDDGDNVRLTTTANNVGIGTTVPATKLEVAGTTTSTLLVVTDTLQAVASGVSVINKNFNINGSIGANDTVCGDNEILKMNGSVVNCEADAGGAGFDSTTIDDTTWSDGVNPANTWTFDVSGTDHTMIAGNGVMTFSDDFIVTDKLQVVASGASIINRNLDVSGNVTSKILIADPAGSQSITAASDTINGETNTHYSISSDADYVLTSTPTIPDGSNGQLLFLHNTGSFLIDVQDESDLAGSNIIVDGASNTIKPSSIMTLLFDSGTGAWQILSNPNTSAAGATADTISVRNSSGSAISAGKAVYVTGFHVGQSRVTIDLADADDPTKMPAIGITAASISNNANGDVISSGTATGLIDTSSASVNDGVWISTTAGEVVFTKPITDAIQKIGTISRANVNGNILVQGAGRSNDIPIAADVVGDWEFASNVGIGTSAVANAVLEVVESGTTPFMISNGAGGDGDFVIVDTAGNVGIGSAVPAALLDVNGGADVTTLNTGQGDNELYAMDQNVQQADGVTFATVDTGQGANELYDMDQNVLTSSDVTFGSMIATNNVGIGTTAPQADLEIGSAGSLGTIDGVDDLFVLDDIEIDGTYYGDGSGLTSLPGGSGGWTDDGTTVRLTTITDNVGIGTDVPSAELEIIESSEVPFMISNGNGGLGDFFFVGIDGNVGIGSTVPSRLLDVEGNTAATVARFATTNALGVNLVFEDVGGTNPNKYIRSRDGTLQVMNSAYSSTLFTIEDGGNVGIGTTVPPATFSITGSIGAAGSICADNEILKMNGASVNCEADAGGGGTANLVVHLPGYSAKITGAFVTHTPAGCSTTASTQGAGIDAGDGNWRLLFDATTDEAAIWQFRMPNNYSSTPVLKIPYSMTSATTNKVEYEASIMCVTDGDAADIGTASFANCVVGSATVPGTAGYLDEISISLTDDSCAAGDMVWIWLSTDADDGTNDNATGDREVASPTFTYTGS